MSSLASTSVTSPTERREQLKAVYEQAKGCTRCPLHQTRTTVVFGSGNADADLMFVGEAPGANEDKQGLPFVGQAGKLLTKLLNEIGLDRGEVFICNTVKCLRDNAMVQLADGSWERIGRLVRSRYGGDVMSVAEDGTLVPRRVTGWHASPLAGRRVFRLTYRSAQAVGSARVSIELTGDHPVLTERGFVAVEELTPDDRIATGQGLSELAHDVVCGTLLGDGSIDGRSAALTLAHSWKQGDYAAFKAQLLEELSTTIGELQVAAVAGGDPTYDVVHVRSRASRALGTLRREFYAPKKRVPKWLAGALTPRMLAIWFMDDGYTRIRPGGRRPLAEIATVCFDDADLQVLIEGLRRLGLPAKASRRRLYFDVPTTERLSEIIAPFVPQSMRYKLHPEVEGRIPYDATRLERGPVRVMYDQVEVQDITDNERADTTFFCIDVEETHNFVTTGGVVHNCRPPNNRDPHPNEIESCNEYLRRQVELIQPTVICTLGNFSTKLLRDDNTGISRLHGQAEIRTIGARAIRLYPLYHPAAALYTPSNLEVLRADFQRIPELLALGAPEQPGFEDDGVPEPAAQAPEAGDVISPDEDEASRIDPDEDGSHTEELKSGVQADADSETVQLGLF
jgi:uracil-DNA glycosylase family 4